jgi:guanylate kinase
VSSAEFKAYIDEPSSLEPTLEGLGASRAEASVPGLQRRVTYATDGWVVNLDTVTDGVHCVEAEVFGNGSSLEEALNLQRRLGVSQLDVLPWSYEQIALMLERAERYRRELGGELERVFFLDGPSGAGKSTVAAALRRRFAGRAEYVRRCTTRAPRPGPEDRDEYRHLDVEEFRAHVDRGEFVESRDFLFGMSYGLRWSDVAAALEATDGPVFGLVNLGSVRHLRIVAPSANRLLLTVPLETVQRRLEARGAHDPAALDERLRNARSLAGMEHLYNYVIVNDDGNLEKTVDTAAAIMLGERDASTV